MLFIMVPAASRSSSGQPASRPKPPLPPPRGGPSPEEMERLKAIVKELGYELLV